MRSLAGYPASLGRDGGREGGVGEERGRRGGEGGEGGRVGAGGVGGEGWRGVEGGEWREGGARAKSPIRPPTLRNITSSNIER